MTMVTQEDLVLFTAMCSFPVGGKFEGSSYSRYERSEWLPYSLAVSDMYSEGFRDAKQSEIAAAGWHDKYADAYVRISKGIVQFVVLNP
jgi:hypothetical protein